MITGWYYLHINGDLIYKKEIGDTAADIRESDFAKAMWPVDVEDRRGAWNMLVEAWALGAKQDRLLALAEKWGMDDQDGHVYANIVGANLFRDGDVWWATKKDFLDNENSPSGLGETILGALGELCKELGLRPCKIWAPKFKDLLSNTERIISE